MKDLIDVVETSDGRFLAHFKELPGVMRFGKTESEAVLSTCALALKILSDHIDPCPKGFINEDGTEITPEEVKKSFFMDPNKIVYKITKIITILPKYLPDKAEDKAEDK